MKTKAEKQAAEAKAKAEKEAENRDQARVGFMLKHKPHGKAEMKKETYVEMIEKCEVADVF